MATNTILKLDTSGKVRTVYGTMTFDSSYPTGGESITLGLNIIYFVKFECVSGYVFEYDSVNGKVKAYYGDYPATGAGALIELPNTSNLLDGKVVRYMAVGE